MCEKCGSKGTKLRSKSSLWGGRNDGKEREKQRFVEDIAD